MQRCVAFIFKCTRACNFACRYCNDHQGQSATLDFEVAARILKQATVLYRSIDVIFHGGEPLLLSRDYFSKILAVQKLLGPGRTWFRNMLQTNGSLIGREWCEFFKTNNFHVGVSLDGPERVQNACRKFTDGGATFDSVIRGISTLADHGVEKYGILAVASGEMLSSDPAELFKFFCEHLRVDSVAAGDHREVSVMVERPALPTWQIPEGAEGFLRSRKQYVSLLCSLYRYWIESDEPRLRIRELANKLDCLVGGRSRICAEGGCCVGKFFGVDTSGDISHCDSFFHDPRFNFGNIKRTSLEEILRSKRFVDARALEIRLRSRCRPCPWFRLCKGGCLYEALLFHESGLRNRMDYCHSKPIYDFIAKDLSRRACGGSTQAFPAVGVDKEYCH